MRAHRTMAWPLSSVYLVLIAYASLYPFAGWRWPPGYALTDLMVLRWLPWAGRFDDWANLLGYAPLGMLLFTAVIRRGGRWPSALMAGLLLPSLLSYTMEVAQHFLPTRVPSGRDWGLNTMGAALGALVAWTLQATGLFDRWQKVRERWFLPDSAGAIALLVLWPMALLFPLPVALGVGQISEPLRWIVEGATGPQSVWVPPSASPPLSPVQESLAIMLGLLAPCLLAIAVTRSLLQRLLMVVGAWGLAIFATTLSTALNFSPDHALAWITPGTWPALMAALAVACVLCLVPSRWAAVLALICLTALVALVLYAPTDPYRMVSLQAWEQGRFVRFHGLAQWVGWLWPHAALVWLVMRLAHKQD